MSVSLCPVLEMMHSKTSLSHFSLRPLCEVLHSETELLPSLDLVHGTVYHTSSLTGHHLVLLGNVLRLPFSLSF